MMAKSHVSAYFHCVFSTKDRRPLIQPALQERLWPFLGGIARQNKMKAVEIGGVEHHQKISFQDEFQRLLTKHGIEFDERYLWKQPAWGGFEFVLKHIIPPLFLIDASEGLHDIPQGAKHSMPESK